MLVFDLAHIYGYEVKALNQQVKRNSGRFPDDFMFQLTSEEIETVKSQVVTSSDASFFYRSGRRPPKSPLGIYGTRDLYACDGFKRRSC